jgi:hypothetical protein
MIKSRTKRWTGHIAQIWVKWNAYGILVVKPEENRPLERPIRRLVDNIELLLREIGWVVLTGLICLRIGTSGWLF